MMHIGTQILETERLVLRKYRIEDAEAMYRNWASDDEVTKFLTWPTHSCVEVSKNVLEDRIELYAHADTYHWAITVKENGDEPVGDIAVVGFREKTATAHIGYCIGKKWWNKGITSEALMAVRDFLFDDVGVNRIEARHDINNPNSGKVMKKCGMKYEGTLRQGDWNNQGIHDVCYYGLVKAERQQSNEQRSLLDLFGKLNAHEE